MIWLPCTAAWKEPILRQIRSNWHKTNCLGQQLIWLGWSGHIWPHVTQMHVRVRSLPLPMVSLMQKELASSRRKLFVGPRSWKIYLRSMGPERNVQDQIGRIHQQLLRLRLQVLSFRNRAPPTRSCNRRQSTLPGHRSLRSRRWNRCPLLEGHRLWVQPGGNWTAARRALEVDSACHCLVKRLGYFKRWRPSFQRSGSDENPKITKSAFSSLYILNKEGLI